MMHRRTLRELQLPGGSVFGSLSIVGVGFVKIPPQFYEKGPFYVQFQVLLILGMLNKPPHYRPFYPMMYSEVSGFGTV